MLVRYLRGDDLLHESEQDAVPQRGDYVVMPWGASVQVQACVWYTKESGQQLREGEKSQTIVVVTVR